MHKKDIPVPRNWRFKRFSHNIILKPKILQTNMPEVINATCYFTHSCNDVKPHGEISVNMYTKVTDQRHWWNCGAADMKWPGWDLMLMAKDFHLAGLSCSWLAVIHKDT